MKKLKEFKTNLTKRLLQKYANFLIERLDASKDDKEFEMWFNQALYLDLFSSNRGIELE